ncbi:MAG: hypothetical protein LCH73_06820 [Proteobacteria bacterium]|nr:hypothetical protein [Pseudomonadota bacterium]
MPIGRVAGSALLCGASLILSSCGGSDGPDVPTPVVHAAPLPQNDTVSLTPGNTASVLDNDTVEGSAARVGSDGNVTFTTTGTLPVGVSVAGGVITLASDMAPGSYSLGYQLCNAADNRMCASATVALTVPPYGTVGGLALDANTGNAVPNVTVRLGGLTALTDATGNYTLPGVPLADRVSVVFGADTHIETSRIARVQAGRTEVNVRLLPYAADTVLPIATGGTATVPDSTAQVVLPANGLVRADGTAASGNVRVRITPISPAVDPAQMPGDYNTLVEGALTPLQSWGALNVRLYDEAGNELNLAPGASATLRIPLSTRSSEWPETVPLYHFDQTAGVWVEEGTATLAGEPGARYYTGTVTHFTTWNADRVYDTIYVNGCVADEVGNRIAHATVITDGISYSGTGTAYTDANGAFSVPMMKSGTAAIVGQSVNLLTNTVRIEAGSQDYALDSCLVLTPFGLGGTLRLTWGELPVDLDSHLLAPDGSHIYYSNPGNLLSAPYANLDVDDVSSFGPEVVTLNKLMVGTYRYSVHNYSGQLDRWLSLSDARVEVNFADQPLRLYVAGAGDSDATDWWNVLEFDVDASCNVTVRTVNSYSSTAPAVTPVTATYCTRP